MLKAKITQSFFIMLCLVPAGIATAQTDYVVTLNGDTIKGKIRFMNYSDSKSVQIITDKKTSYPILQTKAFSLNNEIYHPVRTIEGY